MLDYHYRLPAAKLDHGKVKIGVAGDTALVSIG
jgi:hypothetical protein